MEIKKELKQHKLHKHKLATLHPCFIPLKTHIMPPNNTVLVFAID